MLNSNIYPLTLIILDGWGNAYPSAGNAITQAQTPFFDKIFSAYPHTSLGAAGESVGLPHQQDGNSETGHLNIGAGQIVFQDLARINVAIADESFFQLPGLKLAIDHVKKNNSTLHLMGLVGAGGVHANNEHLFSLIKFAQNNNITNLSLHLFTDGRDSPPTSSQIYLSQIEALLEKTNIGKIASISGRYYAMDRDFRWDRTQKTYQCLTQGIGLKAINPQQAILQSYQAKKTDEFIQPTNIIDANGTPLSLIQDNDAVIFYNFRVDRPRQLTKAFVLKDFEETGNKLTFDPYADKYFSTHLPTSKISQQPFTREKILKNLFFATMTEYQKDLPCIVLINPQQTKYPLAKVLAEHNLNQLHITETEKERFVTYYFNGLRDKRFPNEDWEVIPSPTNIPTYDFQPEMSTPQITQTVIEKLKLNKYHFIIVNIACPDMVAHTGNLKAAIKACEAADTALSKIIPVILAMNGTALVTADHGNAEELINLQTGQIDTEHSNNPVPFILVNKQYANQPKALPPGILADIAPTILKLMNFPKPEEMTGKSLI